MFIKLNYSNPFYISHIHAKALDSFNYFHLHTNKRIMAVTVQQAQQNLAKLPKLKGFGAPFGGFIEDNIEDKTLYNTLAEAACAALMDDTCTGITYMPRSDRYRLRGGALNQRMGSIVNNDHSYLKIRFHPRQTDDL